MYTVYLHSVWILRHGVLLCQIKHSCCALKWLSQQLNSSFMGVFVSKPQSFNNLFFFYRCRCYRVWPVLTPESRRLHMTCCCMHSDRLPLIHLKNFVVLYVSTVYKWILETSGALLYTGPEYLHALLLIQRFFYLVLTWEHFVLCFVLFESYILAHLYEMSLKRRADSRLVWC